MEASINRSNRIGFWAGTVSNRQPQPRLRTLLLVALILLPCLDFIASTQQKKPPFSYSFTTISWLFANIASHIETRPGHLRAMPTLPDQLARALKPLDIIIIAAPFKGTSLFTPGTYTHLGIWLGDQKAWQKNGWWHLPKIDKLREQLINEGGLLQADKHGVRLSPISTITNADKISVYRLNSIARSQKTISEIPAYLGKAYDYNLDGIDKERLICTELVARLFPGLDVQKTTMLGRTFVIPDQIKHTLDSSPAWSRVFHANPDTGH